MKENERFTPKTTGTASWKLRLYSILRIPFTRTIPAIIASTALYLAIYNIAVRKWKGDDHPVNRFMWRIQEQNKTLSPELMEKKQKVLAYHESRFFHPRDTPPELGY